MNRSSLSALVPAFALLGASLVLPGLPAFARHVPQLFEAPADLPALPETLVINCTGLGSRELFGDGELIPVRGQIAILAPQPVVFIRKVRVLNPITSRCFLRQIPLQFFCQMLAKLM